MKKAALHLDSIVMMIGTVCLVDGIFDIVVNVDLLSVFVTHECDSGLQA